MGLDRGLDRTRRGLALALALAPAIVAIGCASPGLTPVRLQRPNAPPRRPGTILVLLPTGAQADRILEGMYAELAPEFDVVAERLERDASLNALAGVMQRVRPVCVVLLDNSTLRLYHRYQRAQSAGSTFPPAVILMSSFLEQTYRSIENATGIAYEVPGVIQFVKLRSIVSRPVRRVGVVSRTPFAAFVARQKALARPEQIELVVAEVPKAPSSQEVSAALERLIATERVDALWILNDNRLLTPELLHSVWLPAVHGDDRIPVIVGVPTLLSKDTPLGSFAMVPDHAALGLQAANLIFDLADADWKLDGQSIQLPVSIKTVVDVEQARKYFGLREDALDKIDHAE